MSYKAQLYPGATSVAKNRKKYMDREYELEKLREVSDDDVTCLLGHRAAGEAFRSVHPPLEELGEPECPIRELVTPTDGAEAGDGVRFVQFADSVYFAPIAPYVRAWSYMWRYRGIDTGTLSGRQIVEARGRDLEKIAKELLTTEVFDAARTGLRGATVHGHAVRLDENGLMFDAIQRYRWNDEKGEVEYVKEQVGLPLDVPISVGKPLSEEELKKRTSMYRVDGTPFTSDKEVVDVVKRIHRIRTLCGFKPFEVRGE